MAFDYRLRHRKFEIFTHWHVHEEALSERRNQDFPELQVSQELLAAIVDAAYQFLRETGQNEAPQVDGHSRSSQIMYSRCCFIEVDPRVIYNYFELFSARSCELVWYRDVWYSKADDGRTQVRMPNEDTRLWKFTPDINTQGHFVSNCLRNRDVLGQRITAYSSSWRLNSV